MAIDWAFSGEGAVSEDAAKLVVTSLVYLERPGREMRALFETVYDGYLAGLRAAGWTGDAAWSPPHVCCRNHVTLSLNTPGWHWKVSTATFQPEMAERIFGHSLGDVVDQHAAVGRFVMTLTDD